MVCVAVGFAVGFVAGSGVLSKAAVMRRGAGWSMWNCAVRVRAYARCLRRGGGAGIGVGVGVAALCCAGR